MKVAIAGTHGSGKTTLLYDVAHRLKSAGHSVALCPEAARQSILMQSGVRSIHGQMEMLSRHITAETVFAARHTEGIVLCDRTAIDFGAYTGRLYTAQNAIEQALVDAMTAFIEPYMKTYDLIFRTTHIYSPDADPNDKLRPTGDQLQLDIANDIHRGLIASGVEFFDLPAAPDTAAQRIVDTIELTRRK